MGDGVSVAARLEAIWPGGVCLSRDAWRQVRDELPETFVDLGDQQLKNIARPMRAYALGGQARLPPAIPSAQPTVVAPASRDGRPVRALIAAAAGVLNNIARLIGAYAEKATTGERPAIRSASVAPSAESRARDHWLRPAIIAAAVISLLAARACSERRPYPPSQQTPQHTGAQDDRLAALRALRSV
jgi:hypothetical protein